MTIKEQIEMMDMHCKIISKITEELKQELVEIEQKIKAREMYILKTELTPSNIIKNGGFYAN